jgi:small subunit ribosomal protein S18
MGRSRSDGDPLPEEVSMSDRAVEDAWSAVDERTMDPYYYSRMRRQSVGTSGRPGSGASSTSQTAAGGRFSFGNPLLQQQTGRRKRQCRLSNERGRVNIDFREIGILSSFVNEHGKIIGRKRSGLSAKAQRKVSRAVKTARQMALLHPEPKPRLTPQEMQEMALAADAGEGNFSSPWSPA